jgi:FkbM family methyltransferase
VSESHSMMLVNRAIEDVRRHLDGQVRRELSTASTLVWEPGMRLAHTINRALRHVNLHVCRATAHDGAIRRSYSSVGKNIALGTVLELQSDSSAFDAAYDALSDEDSRMVFDWFISYRVALAFLGQDADEVAPGVMSMADWQEVLNRARRTFVGGAYRVDGLIVDTMLSELVLTFFMEQYRLQDVVEPKSGDVVLDCGAYRGETALWFARRIGKEGRVVAFEPAVRNAEGLRRNLAANRCVEMAPVTVLECAVSSLAGFLQFNGEAEACSSTDTASMESVPAVTIDDVVERQRLSRVDFIKMDIEGGEVDALKGAEWTLKKYTPQLSICVYHRPRDLPDIVALVRQACSGYQFYLSHKAPGFAEVVLFARVTAARGLGLG